MRLFTICFGIVKSSMAIRSPEHLSSFHDLKLLAIYRIRVAVQAGPVLGQTIGEGENDDS